MNSLAWLNISAPAWVGVEERSFTHLRVTVRAQRPSGAQGRTYNVSIRLGPGNRVTVSEADPGSVLPSCCIERHINPDSTFCLHQDSERSIEDVEAANAWWYSLGVYLDHQDFAAKRGLWPIYAQLSHGEAADIQLQMEAIAEPLGWRDELVEAIFRRRGWLAGRLPRLASHTRRLVNARHPCPRGCKAKHHPFRKESCTRNQCIEGCKKQHHPILRTECPNRSIVEQLVVLEHERRNIEAGISARLIRDDIKCCDTMKHCPLNTTPNQN